MSTRNPQRRQSARRRAIYRRRRAAGVAGVVALATLGAWGVMAATDGGNSGVTAASAATQRSTTAITTAAAPVFVPAPKDAIVDIAAVGDIVMGTPTYGLPSDGGASFFRPVASLFTGDVVMGNLEGTLATGGGSKCGAGSANCFAFETPPSYAKWFKQAGFTTMNVANNHAFDFGADGQRQTLAALRGVGLRWAGRPGKITTQTVRGVRVAMVGFASYPWANDLTDIPAAKVLVERAQANADVVIVVFHGGAEGSDRTHTPNGTETYLGENRGSLRAFSRAVIDSGADLVWGSGPHVMRGMEFYKGRLTAYSLGNFAGYKVFGLGGTLSTSGVLRVRLAADGRYMRGSLTPTRIVGAGTPAPGGDAIALVRSVSQTDFGTRAARISDTGAITRPGT